MGATNRRTGFRPCQSASRDQGLAHMLKATLLGAVLFLPSLATQATPPASAASAAGASATATATAKGEFLGAMETVYPSWFKESFLELGTDVEEAAESGRRLMVLFHQDGCPYCNALVEQNLSQKDIESYTREHFDVVSINIWGDREVLSVDGRTLTEKQFAAALKVQFTPTLIFMNEQGAPVLRLNGYLAPDRFKAALEFVAGRKEAEMSFRDWYAANQPPPTSGALNEQPFFQGGPVDLSAVTGPTAVFFEQTACPNCDRLHGRPLEDAETRRILDDMHSIQLDMWSDTPVITFDGTRTTAREWARALDVKYAPTIIGFDQGREVIRSEAFFKSFHTQGILEYTRSGDYAAQPNFQRWLEARADHFRELGRDVNIWE
ncbi:MAG: thioredoxin family protein [Gammaproteobacteria bacterium]